MRALRNYGFAAMATGVAMLAGVADAQPLRTDLPSYHILGMTKLSLKNYQLNSPCNVGVNCAHSNPQNICGTLLLDDVLFADGSQIAGDKTFFTKPGGIIWQLFRNNNSSLANVTINSPPVQNFPPPIIPNSCDANCTVNVPALEAACGFPPVFPTCDPTKNVTVLQGGDCSQFDTNLGNFECDLPPGKYGNINVQNGAKIVFSAGNYDVCNFRAGRNVTVLANGATMHIPNGGDFKANNGTTIAVDCGDLTVLIQGVGDVAFGRNLAVAAKICAPQSKVSLGHGNTLKGQFVGDVVNANRDNSGECCGGRCACFDDFTPKTAAVGAEVTLASQCDLTPTTEVRVCGVVAMINSKTPSEIKFAVPAGIPGLPKACTIEIISPAGNYMHNTQLQVTP